MTDNTNTFTEPTQEEKDRLIASVNNYDPLKQAAADLNSNAKMNDEEKAMLFLLIRKYRDEKE